MPTSDDQAPTPHLEILVQRILIAFSSMWIVGCGVLFLVTVWPLVLQWRSETFVTTEGVVTNGAVQEVKRTRGSGGTRARRTYTTYDLVVNYMYDVADRQYVGTRYRFSTGQEDLNRHVAEDLIERFPTGASVTVHYDPFHPEWAVLDPGIRDRDRCMLLFILPFFLVLALILWMIGQNTVRRRLYPHTAGVRVRQLPNRLRIHFPSTTWVVTMLIATCIVAFAMIFNVAFRTEFSPNAGQTNLALALVFAGGPIIGTIIWLIRRNIRPQITEIDLATRTVVAPKGPPSKGLGRRKPGPWTEKYDELLDVDVNNRAGRAGATQQQYPPTVVLHLRHGDDERAVCLCQLRQTRRARSLAQWLRKQLPVADPSDASH